MIILFLLTLTFMADILGYKNQLIYLTVINKSSRNFPPYCFVKIVLYCYQTISTDFLFWFCAIERSLWNLFFFELNFSFFRSILSKSRNWVSSALIAFLLSLHFKVFVRREKHNKALVKLFAISRPLSDCSTKVF
jgi:hypothetical protein